MIGPFGTVSRDDDGREVLEFRREYPDPPATVWAALTESERLARWFGSFTGDARPGGTVLLTLTMEEDSGGPPATVRIVECEPHRRLAVVMDDGPVAGWAFTVTLAPYGDGTVLGFHQVLAPDGFPAADVGPGWHCYLDRLGAVLAGTAFLPWPDYEALGDRYR